MRGLKAFSVAGSDVFVIESGEEKTAVLFPLGSVVQLRKVTRVAWRATAALT